MSHFRDFFILDGETCTLYLYNSDIRCCDNQLKKKKSWVAHAMKRLAAGAHLSTSWLFEPAKRSDDRADYCLDCSFLPQWKHRVLIFTLEWNGARPMGEQW